MEFVLKSIMSVPECRLPHGELFNSIQIIMRATLTLSQQFHTYNAQNIFSLDICMASPKEKAHSLTCTFMMETLLTIVRVDN
jgi:hypothetical protein